MPICPICLKKRKLYPLFIGNNGIEYFVCGECKENFFDMVMGNQRDMQKGALYIKNRLPHISDISLKNDIVILLNIIENIL